jgi:DNA-3-methyladenine glycosylase
VRDDPVAGTRAGTIVEVEAYIGEEDLASHARFGETARNRVMFGPPGMAYVYLVYGMYDCLNVVTEPAGRPAAVLVRAVAPSEGIDLMRAARLEWAIGRRRAIQPGQAGRIADLPVARLASGPGLVCAAFGIDRAATGTDLCDPASPVRLEAAPAAVEVAASPRIGVGYAGVPWTDVAWRFFVPGEPSVSGRRRR